MRISVLALPQLINYRLIYIFLVLWLGKSLTLSAQSQPNIILIVADDAGYADFGFQGSKSMKTPHLDRLAREGMQCKQAYVTAAVCGPSRAGLLTGRYQQRFGFEENNVPGYMSSGGLTGDNMGLPLSEKTMADYLKELGYRTTIIGKWHQGNADRYHPLKRGFDEFYGFRGGARSYFPFNKEHPVSRNEDRLERGFGEFKEAETYLTEALAEEANRFITRNQNQPFFLFLTFNAVHTPMEAKKEDLAAFPNLEGKRQYLAAMNLAMDRACGQIFRQLDLLDLHKNTLVIFMNDNGGPSDTNASDNSPLSGTKANHLEGGIRIPFIIRWPEKIAANASFDYPISTLDLLPTFIKVGGKDPDSLLTLDGVNLLPYLTGENPHRPHQVLYWKKENRGAIREGDWKMLRFPDRPAELYYLPDDIAEKNNLANQYPDRVRKMYKKLFQWELTLKRPLWQLKRQYEGAAMKRMDAWRQ